MFVQQREAAHVNTISCSAAPLPPNLNEAECCANGQSEPDYFVGSKFENVVTCIYNVFNGLSGRRDSELPDEG